MKSKQLLANPQKQLLSEHLFAVGYIAYRLIQTLNIASPKIAQSAFLAGVLHDIGKTATEYQNWLNKQSAGESSLSNGVHITKGKFKGDNYPQHNELSWLIAQSILKGSGFLNSSQIQQICHTVLYHHARPNRKDTTFFESAEGLDRLATKMLGGLTMADLMLSIEKLLKEIERLCSGYGELGVDLAGSLSKFSYDYKVTDTLLPVYKNYTKYSEQLTEFGDSVKANALNNLVRMAVIYADKLISGLSGERLSDLVASGELETLLPNKVIDSVFAGVASQDTAFADKEIYDNLTTALLTVRDKAVFENQDNVTFLQETVGISSIEVVLGWASKTKAPQVFWICPRLQNCMAVLEGFKDGRLPHGKIEIFTSEHKKTIEGGYVALKDVPDTAPDAYFTGDIVITTIDQMVTAISSVSRATALFNIMRSHVVFDQFHELTLTPALNFMFAELVLAKKQQLDSANTLLISATPDYCFLENILGIKSNRAVMCPVLNDPEYRLVFTEYKELTKSPISELKANNNKVTFFVANTAQDAQLGFLSHCHEENAILLHSKYIKSDKKALLDATTACFGRSGDKQYQILRSSQIVQNSLDISCEELITDLTNAENWLQRLLLLNRFAGNKSVGQYTTLYPASGRSYPAMFLADTFSWSSGQAWRKFLENKLGQKQSDITNLSEILSWYQSFYDDQTCLKSIESDLLACLKQSVVVITSKLFEPIAMSEYYTDAEMVKIVPVSLRGDNCFVQMAVCYMDENSDLHFADQYAYPEDTDFTKVTIGLTEKISRLKGGSEKYRDSKKDLISFMHKKHSIIKGVASCRFDWQLLNKARLPNHPIYLSYTPSDLEKLGKMAENHPSSMYYVLHDKQVIGVMPMDKLSTKPS